MNSGAGEAPMRQRKEWAAVREILDEALALPTDRRAAYLDAACASDTDLRAEVESLICAAEGSGLLDRPVVAEIPPAPAPPPAAMDLPEQLGRFRLVRKLGQGGMGRVYEAWDTENQARVALKTVAHRNTSHLFLFKQEFRSSSQISHANLIALYELFAEGDEWFFTMEYLAGRNFLEYYQRTSESGTGALIATTEATQTITQVMETGRSAGGQRAGLAAADYVALRDGLLQLAEGVAALHRAGKLHRDIKSANVMVTEEGRVVLLDFGLMIDAEVESDAWLETRHAGTLAYMAPEQLQGQKLGPEADWYAVGVLLYQALTGMVPFTGSAREILQAKRSSDPVPPQTLAPAAPADLCELCLALLRREPAERPAADEMLNTLGEADVASRGPVSRALWIGRERELTELRTAARDAASASVVMLVGGSSGMGKSALVQRFLRELDAPEVMILNGRCGEQEFVPYKAMDGLMDSLSHRLARLPDGECAALLPDDLPALARLFPALERLLPHPVDVQLPINELRRRGVAALRELLRRLGERWRLVLAIDDMQWGDVDSAILLDQILHGTQAPRLLLLGTYRTEEESASEFLKLLCAPPADSTVAMRRLALGPLDATESTQLARQALGETEDARALIEQAGGNTYLLLELLSHTGPARGAVSLDELLWERVRQLPEPAQRLLEVATLAVKPVRQELLFGAAALTGADRYAVTTLRNHRLVRTSKTGRPEIEPFHDRVRETVRARMAPEVMRERHASLADMWERTGDADPEDLATHHHGAGHLPVAARYYAQAAERSDRALAFDRAAAQWRQALANGTWQTEEVRRLRGRLAEALVNGGRSADAAEEYETLLDGAPAKEHADLNRLSAYHYCVSGSMEKGKSRLKQVLGAHGVWLPASNKTAFVPLLWAQAKVKRRGSQYRLRPASEVPPGLLARIDDFWAAGTALGSAELVLGGYFMLRCVDASIEAGEPNRLVRALACDAMMRSMRGSREWQAATALLDKCTELIPQTDQPQPLGMIHLARGMLLASRCRFRDAAEEASQAVRIFRERCPGANWEIYTSQTVEMLLREGTGEWQEVRRLAAEHLAEARDRRDLVAQRAILTSAHLRLHMVDDNLAEAERATKEAFEQVAPDTTQYHQALQTQILVDLFNDPARGLRRYDELPWKTKLALRLDQGHLKIHLCYLVGSCALAAGDRAAQPEPLARRAQALGDEAVKLEDNGIARAYRATLHAGAAMLLGRRDEALAHTLSAERFYDECQAGLVHVARCRKGLLLGGEEGSALLEAGLQAMRTAGYRNPQRILDIHLPGFARVQ